LSLKECHLSQIAIFFFSWQKSFLQKRITELQSELVVVSAAGTERAAQLAAQHAELSHQRDLQIEELQVLVYVCFALWYCLCCI
jgi:hypothetical protein